MSDALQQFLRAPGIDSFEDKAVAVIHRLEAELAELREENARLKAIVDKLHDLQLAQRVARNCYDPNHSEHYCSTCVARADGIEAYRQAVHSEAAQKATESKDG